MTIELKAEFRTCNDVATVCATVCAETLQYSLQKGGRFAEESHIQALLDCVDLCRANTEYMGRGSSMAADICDLCAEACRRCTEACESFSDDPQMRACAEACRQCTTACGAIAA